jgi:hypothetical protein
MDLTFTQLIILIEYKTLCLSFINSFDKYNFYSVVERFSVLYKTTMQAYISFRWCMSIV